MTTKHAIAFSLILTVAFAMPPSASAQFNPGLQTAEIANQVQQLANRITRYTTLLNQFTSLDCAAQGMGAGAEATPVNQVPVACNTLNMVGAFRIPTSNSFKRPPTCATLPCRFPTGGTSCKPPTPFPWPTFRTSTRAIPRRQRMPLPYTKGSANPRIGGWSWPMPNPMP